MHKNIFQLRLKIPFTLSHVYAYAIGNTEGWFLIDAGMNNPGSRTAWEQFFQEHQIAPGKIKGIIITHHHPDHYGAAGWLQDFCQAPVYMTTEDKKSAELAWQEWSQNIVNMKALYQQHGAPGEITADLEKNLSRLIQQMQPYPEVEPVEDGTILSTSSLSLKVIRTPGHSDGHISIILPETHILFSGDHLLPEITTNVGLRTEASSVDPLGDYLQSLDKIATLEIKTVYPGHGPSFNQPQKRIDQLREHHRQRLLEIRKFSEGGVTAYQISMDIFGRDISAFERRLALAETLAHLNYLEYRGEIRSYDTGEMIIYDQVL